MKIITTGKGFDVVFMSVSTAATLDQKMSFDDPTQPALEKGTNSVLYKFAPNSFQAVRRSDDGELDGTENDVSVSLRNQLIEPLRFGQIYRLEGTVAVTHYVTSSKRLGVSIVADSIVPVKVGGNE